MRIAMTDKHKHSLWNPIGNVVEHSNNENEGHSVFGRNKALHGGILPRLELNEQQHAQDITGFDEFAVQAGGQRSDVQGLAPEGSRMDVLF